MKFYLTTRILTIKTTVIYIILIITLLTYITKIKCTTITKKDEIAIKKISIHRYIKPDDKNIDIGYNISYKKLIANNLVIKSNISQTSNTSI